MQANYVPLTLLIAYRAAELSVNMLLYNIEMGIKELALILSGKNIICSVYDLKITHIDIDIM